jgi:tetratricopeptide (TPR) repeat protein
MIATTMQSFLYRRRALWILALALACPLPLRAEEGILVVHVEDTKGTPVSGVELAPKGDGAPGAPTDRLGKTRLRLAPATRPGHWVTLQILPNKSGPEWVFISPWTTRALVPSFANESDNFVEIVVGERGNPDLLASDKVIKASVARTLEQLAPRLDKSEITDEERKRVLIEQAAAFGLKPSEVDEAIRAWGDKAQDPYDAGLAALYARNYPLAEKRLEKSLEARRQERDEAQAKVAEAAFFLGSALAEQGKYREAVAAYQESLEVGGEDHIKLNQLGAALVKAGDLQAAASRLKRALELSEKSLGEEHLGVAPILNNLAVLYRNQGQYAEAEPLYKRSLKILEKSLGTEHWSVATSLDNLAVIYKYQNRYSEAEPLHQRSLKIREKVLGAEHRDVAMSLNNLAVLYGDQGRYSEAEPLYLRSLKIWEKALGAEHPDVVTSLNNLATLYNNQGRYSEAEPLLQRSLKIREKVLGPEHPDVVANLDNLAVLYDGQGRYSEAEPLFLRSLQIEEKLRGPEHPNVAIRLNNLATLYHKQQKLETAESFAKRALTTAERSFGTCHQSTAIVLYNYAAILQDFGRADEAEPLLTRMKAIQAGACKP